VFAQLLRIILGFSISPLSAAVIGFTDVPQTANHQEGITYLKQKDVISGYKDGTFRPDHTVNRAEFIKILTKLLVSQSDIDSCLKTVTDRFTDVPENSWFAPAVCAAQKNGYISGYKDGTFHPADTLNIAEASKMLVHAFTLKNNSSDSTEWYAPSILSLAAEHAIPDDVHSTGESLTRGVMADMLWRLKTGNEDAPAADGQALLSATCDWFTKDQIPHVDIQEVRRVWASWINDARAVQGLAPYTQNKELNYSATLWSLHAKQAGGISHKRTGQKAYYDYGMIKNWFSNLDLDFSNVKSATFTENVGWGIYSCKKADCTQDLIDDIRTTFDFYMGEKGKASDSHYRSIMKPEFRLIGMGIAVDSASGKYYITTHYGTAITSNPHPICP
jgi:hypothetical protein